MKYILILLSLFASLAAQATEEKVICEFAYAYVNGAVGSDLKYCDDYLVNNTFGDYTGRQFNSEEDARDFIKKNKRITCLISEDTPRKIDFDDRFVFYSCYTKKVFLDSKYQ